MTCDTMDGNYTEKNELDVVTGRKNVVIIRGDTLRATGDKAVYDAKTAIITLTGNPEVTEGESQLLADIVKIYVNEDKSEAEGNVKMKLVQKKTPAPVPHSVQCSDPMGHHGYGLYEPESNRARRPRVRFYWRTYAATAQRGCRALGRPSGARRYRSLDACFCRTPRKPTSESRPLR